MELSQPPDDERAAGRCKSRYGFTSRSSSLCASLFDPYKSPERNGFVDEVRILVRAANTCLGNRFTQCFYRISASLSPLWTGMIGSFFIEVRNIHGFRCRMYPCRFLLKDLMTSPGCTAFIFTGGNLEGPDHFPFSI